MLKIKKSSTVSFSLVLAFASLSFLVSPYTVDFDNYAGYASRLDIATERFRREFAFSVLIRTIGWVFEDPRIATRIMYAITTAIATAGFISVTSVFSRLVNGSIKSTIMLGVVLAFPVIALAVIYPRHGAALGLSLFAVSYYYREFYLPTRQKYRVRTLIIWFSIWLMAGLMNNYSGLLYFLCFLFVWRPTCFLLSVPILAVITTAVIYLSSLDVTEWTVVERAVHYLVVDSRLTGRWRVAYAVMVAMVAASFLVWRMPVFFSAAHVVRSIVLVLLITPGYFFLTTELARVIAFPNLILIALIVSLLCRRRSSFSAAGFRENNLSTAHGSP